MPSLVSVSGGFVDALDADKPMAVVNKMINQSIGVGIPTDVPVAAWYPESGGSAGNFSGTVDTSTDLSATLFEANFAWNGNPLYPTQPDVSITSTYAWHLVFDFNNYSGNGVTWDQVFLFGHNFNINNSPTDRIDFLAADSIAEVQSISGAAAFSIGNAITPGSANPVIYSPYKNSSTTYRRADDYRYLQIRFSSSTVNYVTVPPQIGEVVVGERIQFGRRAVRPFQAERLGNKKEKFESDAGNIHRFIKARGQNSVNHTFQIEPSANPSFSINDATQFESLLTQTEAFSRPVAWVEFPTENPNRILYYEIQNESFIAPFTDEGAVRNFTLEMKELAPFYAARVNNWT